MDTTPQAVSPRQLAWLRDELAGWQADGLVTDEHAAAILDRYRAVRRAGLARLMLHLGAAFVGVGLIWLVAANLDQFPPIGRFLVVTTLWLGVTVAAEVLASRSAASGRGQGSPLVGAARGLAALAFGAVVFQSAQSLQVPAYEPALVGAWGLGALLYAYAVRGVAPLLVGLVAGVVWLVWHVGANGGSGLGVVLALLLAAAVASGAAVLHDRFGPADFVAPWRELGAALGLVGLFAAAVPYVTAADFGPDAGSWAALVLGVVLALVAAGLARGEARLEPLVALGTGLVAAGLVLWDPGTAAGDRVGFEDWLHAGVSITAYVGAATWAAVLGIQRSSERLTYLALAALVAFTTFQSFAVFAQIIEGAWLFVALGLVFLGSGYLFDRARRGLTEAVTA
jgi:uncharacterized membrane protein